MKQHTNFERKNKRDEQKSQGAFDGRFRSRVVTDKKKQQSKREARNFRYQG